MSLKEYFDNARGIGILATSDFGGNVDAAVYSIPHILDEDTISFTMADRLSHKNLQSNPHAAYIFVESGDNTKGKRLFLTKIRDETNKDIITGQNVKGDKGSADLFKDRAKFHVQFKIDRITPLMTTESEMLAV